MTVYEQIQNAIEYAEDNLSGRANPEEAAEKAHMSLRSLYNYFQAITGYSFGEYYRKRRLAEALKTLESSDEKIVNLAFEFGYESHEAFTRAFRSEFGLSPVQLKKEQPDFKGLRKIKVLKEMYMGVVVKKLDEMKALAFDGFAPDPEDKAVAKMESWVKEFNKSDAPQRIFGHNIDQEGNLSSDPENIGYRVLLALDESIISRDAKASVVTIPSGKFVVTGIEGNFDDDKEGKWIMEGWQKLQKMIKGKNYNVKCPGRWFEEVLEASQPGNMRLDLYLEIE